ncbi:MAG: FAD-binding oxidoreductase [Candidatus Dormibacteria bacterium]
MSAGADRLEPVRERLGPLFSTDPAVLLRFAGDTWPLNLLRARRGDPLTLPLGVARPTSEDLVVEAVRACGAAGVAVVPAGNLTGVTGAANAVPGAITLCTADMNRVLEIDTVSNTVTVEPGITAEALDREVARHGLELGHHPTTYASGTLGGYAACRSAGQESTRNGKIEDMTVGLRVVLAGGSVLDTGNAPRAATGPDLRQLFLGSEGTLGVITRLTLRLTPRSTAVERQAWLFPGVAEGLTACRVMLQAGIRPAVQRLYDPDDSAIALASTGLAVEPGALLVVVLRGGSSEVEMLGAEARRAATECAGRDLGVGPAEHWERHRDDFSAGRLGQLMSAPGSVVDTVEVCASWTAIESIHRQALDRLRGQVILFAHFSHGYSDGATAYFTFAGNAEDDTAAEELYFRVWETLMSLTIEHGGAISHHHGAGLVRNRWLERANPEAHSVRRRLKAALDPEGLFNPGKQGL